MRITLLGLALLLATASSCGGSSTSGVTMTTLHGRTFHVWAPPSYDATREYPVVLAFHGHSSSGRGFEKWFRMEDHTGGEAFTVYPDSNGKSWDMAGDSDLKFTAEMLDALSDAYRIDRSHVLAFGFSYGGRFVNHLGCKRPDLVRAVVVGGGAWDSEKGCAPLPVLVVHRTNDTTMPISGARSAATRWATIDGCTGGSDAPDAHGCATQRSCAAGAVTFCEDMHHDPAWPRAWNHTVREEYRTLAWQWFLQLH